MAFDTLISGGPTDGRMSFDSSMWTVSTGGSKATGGARFDSTGGPFGGSEQPGAFQVLTASESGQQTIVLVAAAAAVALVLIVVLSKRKKKGK